MWENQWDNVVTKVYERVEPNPDNLIYSRILSALDTLVCGRCITPLSWRLREKRYQQR